MTSSSTSVTSLVEVATLGAETSKEEDDPKIKIDKMAFRSMLHVGNDQRTGAQIMDV